MFIPATPSCREPATLLVSYRAKVTNWVGYSACGVGLAAGSAAIAGTESKSVGKIFE
ncbi:hypothetical protein [Pelotomaculum propionicicum]|uniref:hypothetical protein n=1 Tax=Pelotomaculum propionicicum TaxID=258475 RepID=UPI001698F402|nr:hypothetical protein [Pelotomaculum propionicicum]NLI14492.1 hypothetical protein [Peptococcaceae bacterium]